MQEHVVFPPTPPPPRCPMEGFVDLARVGRGSIWPKWGNPIRFNKHHSRIPNLYMLKIGGILDVEVSARARIQGKYRVCWDPLQTRKDTRQVLRPLYNCPFSIQALFFFSWQRLRRCSDRGRSCIQPLQSARATPQPIGLSMERDAQRQSILWARAGPPTVRNHEFSRTLAVAQAGEIQLRTPAACWK